MISLPLHCLLLLTMAEGGGRVNEKGKFFVSLYCFPSYNYVKQVLQSIRAAAKYQELV